MCHRPAGRGPPPQQLHADPRQQTWSEPSRPTRRRRWNTGPGQQHLASNHRQCSRTSPAAGSRKYPKMTRAENVPVRRAAAGGCPGAARATPSSPSTPARRVGPARRRAGPAPLVPLRSRFHSPLPSRLRGRGQLFECGSESTCSTSIVANSSPRRQPLTVSRSQPARQADHFSARTGRQDKRPCTPCSAASGLGRREQSIHIVRRSAPQTGPVQLHAGGAGLSPGYRCGTCSCLTRPSSPGASQKDVDRGSRSLARERLGLADGAADRLDACRTAASSSSS